MELQKISNITPASFITNNKEDSLQIKLILHLLKNSIKNGIPITLEDIRNTHAEYAMLSRRNGSGWNWFINEKGEKIWRQAKSKEEWVNSYSTSRLSILWFKNNLGAAILKGRILAIPVIEINEII